MTFTPRNPAKATVERLALLYSPVWMAVMAVVTLTGAFRDFGDVEYMALGVGLALPLWLLPLFVERDRPLVERHAFRWSALLLVFSLIQNYFGAQLFFRTFGMEYHFRTKWILNGSPVFLTWLTCAYFSTYFVLMQIGYRASGHKLWARVVLSYAMAFGETAAMANRHLAGFFSYRDPTFVMLWGSLAYGTIFFVTLPLFAKLDEERPMTRPLGTELWDFLALNMLCLCLYEVFDRTLYRWMAPGG